MNTTRSGRKKVGMKNLAVWSPKSEFSDYVVLRFYLVLPVCYKLKGTNTVT